MRDDVVRFHAVLLELDNIERLNQTVDERDLRLQVVGHFHPIGFVFIVHFVPKGRRPAVHGNGDVRTLEFFD